MEANPRPTQAHPLVKDHNWKMIAQFAVLEIYWVRLFACNEDVNKDDSQRRSHCSN